MITRLTKIQLAAFAVITVAGTAVVGTRYAEVDRYLVDRAYEVTADLPDSGGIFEGAEVTYRGIAIGRVGDLAFIESGVRARLDLEKIGPDVPADLEAVVANKSAIGEQYVDLRPRGPGGPFLADGDRIARKDTAIPIDTTTLLTHVQRLVGSVDADDLGTVVDELGAAFEGTGNDLATILDSSAAVLTDARDNLDVTRRLIRDSGSVLATQVDQGSQIRSFASDLALFSDALAGADGDLRFLLDEGPTAAAATNAVVAENAADLSTILADIVGPVTVARDNVRGLQAIYLLYPYVLSGTYTVVSPNGDGEYNAAFGNLVASEPPVCSFAKDGAGSGYRELRPPQDIDPVDFDPSLGCAAAGKVPPHSSTRTELNRPASGTDDRKDQLTWLLMGPTA